ncbi:MAG: hypothetical protein QME51_08130 [Planctomycetota bacterium]|nr:hypothetical protein [Planctomycetota bacterium]
MTTRLLISQPKKKTQRTTEPNPDFINDKRKEDALIEQAEELKQKE